MRAPWRGVGDAGVPPVWDLRGQEIDNLPRRPPMIIAVVVSAEQVDHEPVMHHFEVHAHFPT